MRPRTILLTVLLLAVVGGLAAGIYAYDDARADKIGKGVSVGGIPLQGLTRAEARAKLERLILDPLERPVVVHHDKSTWRLGAKEARISVDLDAMVDKAMDVSREGNIFARTVRNLTGKSLNAHMEPTVRYSDKAIVRMLDKIRGAIDRKPIDARAKIDSSGIETRESRTGLEVRASLLHKNIRRALVSTTADRTFIARTRKLQPKVSTKDIEDRYGTAIIVHRDQFRLTLYKQLKPAKTYSIAVGQAGLETPAGLYHIQNKAVNPAWNVPDRDWAGDLAGTVVPGGSPENPLKARWLGIFDGAGIHGTDAINSIGTAASHGCIRMRIPDVIELYDRVPVGAPVYIA
ncbi:MAG TPA: L,D-transpeptidase/peptidoglycan binding protein [Solirubrobacteraceae bacterium]|nr:L,D-transpeptidase/peptidoglycan binding protein [Solirubrobacteraceae bacterium]